ncbi:MAG: hypothetical protein AB7L09_10480 [Nitrospira sp.]
MPRASSMGQFLVFSRKIGFASIVLGGAGMITGPEYFWFAVALVNVGLLLVFVDVVAEKWKSTALRWALIVMVLTSVVGFNWFWVFVDLPMPVSVMVVNGEYSEGTSIAGIPWQPKFTELQVEVVNSSKRNYEDLNIVFKPNLPVAAISQLTTYQGVVFEDRYGVTMRAVEVHGAEQKASSQVLVATDAGYRMRCDKLPAGGGIRVVMAIADVKYDPAPASPGEPLFKKEGLIRIKMKDGSTYWYGQKGIDHYTPRIRPTGLEVTGDYVAGQRRREVFADLKF